MSDASATFAQSGQYSASRFPRAYQLLVISAGSESSHLPPAWSGGKIMRRILMMLPSSSWL